jgi:thymidylate synthase (FAD)
MNEALSELQGKVFPVLDDGHVCLVDWMGDDAAICEAARVSFGTGTKRVSEDRDLIRYLIRHSHSTPLEMCEVKLRVRVPMDAWRQWIRHRTASVNEYSTRYSEAIDSAQRTTPDSWRSQSTANKQGSGGFVTEWPDSIGQSPTNILGRPDWESPGHYLSDMESSFQYRARQVYEERLKFGVAREQARKDLPLSTYTESYWKCDLKNLLHFLRLRMDSHAQKEIRDYANIIGHQIVAKLFPITWEAFVDYQIEAMTLTRLDIEAIKRLDSFNHNEALDHITNKRERQECREKLVRLGILPES